MKLLGKASPKKVSWRVLGEKYPQGTLGLPFDPPGGF